MAQFPSIKPSQRQFTFGEYPTKTYRALSGAVLRRSFGNRPFNYSLSLSFENVKESVVAAIFDHYHGQQGTLEGFTLPDALFAGLSSTIISRMKAPSSLAWFYAESPSIESVQRDLSTVSIQLVADIAL